MNPTGWTVRQQVNVTAVSLPPRVRLVQGGVEDHISSSDFTLLFPCLLRMLLLLKAERTKIKLL